MAGESHDLNWTLPDSLRELADEGTPELVNEVLSVFRIDSTERLALLRSALEAGDRQELRSQAHTLKGSAAQVGAVAMAEACQEIETLAKEGDLPGLAVLVARAEKQFFQVCGVMRRQYGE